MKPVKLSGHHIPFVKYFAKNGAFPSSHYEGYGIKFAENESKVYDKIFDKKTPIIVIDGFDDICAVCKFRTEKGCLKLSEDKFHPLEELIKSNQKIAKSYNVEIGKVYDNEDFFGIIKKTFI